MPLNRLFAVHTFPLHRYLLVSMNSGSDPTDEFAVAESALHTLSDAAALEVRYHQ